MCTSPSFVWVKRGPEWVKIPAPCDRCWSCRENYVSDWVGRCLAEADCGEDGLPQTCCTLSLTYAPPTDPLDLAHRVVDPYHFQLFMKRLRNAGHKVRYLVAGEYGDKKGRSHFHAILFFSHLAETGQPAPVLEDRKAFRADPSIAKPFSRQMPHKEMCHISEWPHGHVEADWSMTEKSVRYCCEYLYQDGKRTAWFSQSKKPQIGFYWFAAKAMRNRQYGVLPSSFEYLPPGGKPGKKYLMTGATRRDYLNLITQDPKDRNRMSKWVRATFDKLERQAFADSCRAGFNDEAFLARQRPEIEVRAQIERDDWFSKLASDAILQQVAWAWGFNNVQEFEIFAEAGGCEAHPEYYRNWAFDVQDGASAQEAGKRPSAADLRRPPTSFDREGNPLWIDPDRDYLPGAFKRSEGPGAGEGTPSDA